MYPECLQWTIQNVYLWEIITFDLYFYNYTKCYIRTSKQLIKLIYNDNMKNLTYNIILICFNCVQSVFWNIDRKPKNLMYSLICFNGVKSVFWNIDRKALSVWDNHIDSVFTTTRKCLLWINKQLINLDYDDMKNLT